MSFEVKKEVQKRKTGFSIKGRTQGAIDNSQKPENNRYNTDVLAENRAGARIVDIYYELADKKKIGALLNEQYTIEDHIADIVQSGLLDPSFEYTFNYKGKNYEPTASAKVINAQAGDDIKIIKLR